MGGGGAWGGLDIRYRQGLAGEEKIEHTPHCTDILPNPDFAPFFLKKKSQCLTGLAALTLTNEFMRIRYVL